MAECNCTKVCQLSGWVDQFQPATREVLVFTKSAKRYFDLDAVREPHKASTLERNQYRQWVSDSMAAAPRRGDYGEAGRDFNSDLNPGGAPPLDWWNLPWGAVRDRLVKAMVPERVCKTCGEPQRRITKTKYVEVPKRPLRDDDARRYGSIDGKRHNDHRATQQITLGWTDCGHDDWRPGVVFDPFLKPGEPMTATMYIGDVLDVLGKLPENSVDLVLSSPPFLALRSYLPSDHPLKEKEGGSQSTPGEYIDWLLDVVEACDRVLAPHGSLCFELGDTYAGNAPGDQYQATAAWHDGRAQPEHQRKVRFKESFQGWPLAKSLSLIPESFRFAMVYGQNPFTGRQTDRWRLRNVIRWVRPNPPVGALGDKFRPATSELMVFCKSAKRYFDLDAVREPFAEATRQRERSNAPASIGGRQEDGGHRNNEPPMRIQQKMTHEGAPPLDWWEISLLDEEAKPYGPKTEATKYSERVERELARNSPGWQRKTINERGDKGQRNFERSPAGAPPLDWWNIPPGGYEGAHYAVWPPELLIKPIKAMCPEHVCRTCGEARRRIAETTNAVGFGLYHSPGRDGSSYNPALDINKHAPDRTERITLGFTDCGHNDYRPGLVLDPFAGSGTTLAVASGHGRDSIGIDLDDRNFELALERVGPLVLERGEVAA